MMTNKTKVIVWKGNLDHGWEDGIFYTREQKLKHMAQDIARASGVEIDLASILIEEIER